MASGGNKLNKEVVPTTHEYNICRGKRMMTETKTRKGTRRKEEV